MTDKQRIKVLEEELKRARLDVCELCERCGENVCKEGVECDWNEENE